MTDGFSDLSLSQLRCFLAIVDAGSFAEAGRRLGLSPPAVSKTMARLEAAHGVKLLHRSTHAVSLTDEGRALVPSARAAELALREVARILDHAGTRIGGTVRLTEPVGFLRHCVVPLLPTLRRASPDIHLDLRASNDLLRSCGETWRIGGARGSRPLGSTALPIPAQPPPERPLSDAERRNVPFRRPGGLSSPWPWRPSRSASPASRRSALPLRRSAGRRRARRGSRAGSAPSRTAP